MEQRCVHLFGNEWKKYYNVTIHCVRCTSSPWSLCVQRLFFIFFFHFFFSFWFDFESKNGCGAFIWKLSESLKARRFHQQVCFCALLVFIDSVLVYGEMHCGSPLKTLIHSRRDQLQKGQERLLLTVND